MTAVFLLLSLGPLQEEGWWNADWGFRRRVTIRNHWDRPLPAGFQVSVTLDPAYLELTKKMRKDRADVAIVSGGKEISSRAQADARVWFRLARPIPRGGEDRGYWVYYGNPRRRTATSAASVFDFEADFATAKLRRFRVPDQIALGVEGTAAVIRDVAESRTEASPALLTLRSDTIPTNFRLSLDVEWRPAGNASFEFGLQVDLKESIERDETREGRIAGWIKKLGADSWDVREAAMKELIRIGRPAVPALTEALKSKDPEIRSRAEKVLSKVREAYPWPGLRAGIRIGDPSLGAVAAIWTVGKSVNRMRTGFPRSARLTVELARDPDGFFALSMKGVAIARPVQMKGEPARVSLYLFKSARGPLGEILLHDLRIRRCLDDEVRPTSTLEVEQKRP